MRTVRASLNLLSLNSFVAEELAPYRLDRKSQLGWILPPRPPAPVPTSLLSREVGSEYVLHPHPSDRARCNDGVKSKPSFDLRRTPDRPIVPTATIRSGTTSFQAPGTHARQQLGRTRPGSAAVCETVGRFLSTLTRPVSTSPLRARVSVWWRLPRPHRSAPSYGPHNAAIRRSRSGRGRRLPSG